MPLQSLAVLESEGGLLLVTASENQSTLYLIEAEEVEDHSDDQEEDSADFSEEKGSVISESSPLSLKICKQFSLEEEVVFLASDHVDHLFAVTEGENGLTASIYSLKSQYNQLEVSKIFSFEPFSLPGKVVFDRVNNLLFILYDELLEIYKYHAMLAVPLQIISKIETTDFRWHQRTKKLLLADSGQLYQFGKGKFRLIRSINNSSKSIELTSQGVLCTRKDPPGLFLLSQKNPNHKKEPTLPPIEPQMKHLQDESMERFCRRGGYDTETDPKIGKLEITCLAAEILVEYPDYLLIYTNMLYYQSASQRIEYSSWDDFGGAIYTQRLLQYNFTQKEYKVLEDDNRKSIESDRFRLIIPE